jgi:hypothetical protein
VKIMENFLAYDLITCIAIMEWMRQNSVPEYSNSTSQDTP